MNFNLKTQWEHALSEGALVTATRKQVSCDLEGETVILGLESGVYYGLNAIGASVWKLIQEPRTVEELCESILREYGVESNRCRRDCLAFLHEMEGYGLLHVAAPPL